jgi:hypothetical protein
MPPTASPPAESDPPTSDTDASPPPWPARYALLTAWTRPATTTARMHRVSPSAAYAVHLVSLAATVLVGVALGAIAGVWEHGRPLGAEFLRIVEELVTELIRQGGGGIIELGIAIVVIEGVFVVLALMIAPFGARDERFRSSLGHALRRTWLHTPHIPVAILLAGLPMIYIQITESQCRQVQFALYERINPPPVPPEDSNDRAAWRKYRAEYHRYSNASWTFVQNHKPWWMSIGADDICGDIALAASVWFVWTLYRGVSAPRPVPPRTHEPLCRWCGYNLTALPPDARCPECGTQVERTLGEDAPRGAPWENRIRAGRLRAFSRTFMAGMRDPADLGRELTQRSARHHPLRFLAVNLAICGLALGAAVAGEIYALRAIMPLSTLFEQDWLALLHMTLFVGAWFTLLGLVIVGLAGLALGTVARIRVRRNLLPWAGQLVAYTSGYLTLWAITGSALMLAFTFRSEELNWLSHQYGISRGAIEVITLLTVHGLAALGYLIHIIRAARGIRYAWR